MNGKDLLQYIESLERMIEQRQQQVRRIKAGTNEDHRLKCMTYSMYKLIPLVKRDVSKLDRELKNIYTSSAFRQPASDYMGKYEMNLLLALLGKITYHTKILGELLLSIQNGEWTISTPSGVDLNRIVSHWVNQISDYPFPDSAIDIRLRLNSGIPPIEMRDCELFQIVCHILINAIEALSSAEDGMISIKTDIIGEHILLEVMDNGYGIRTEIRDKIFQPHYSTKKNEHNPEAHPGIGLYIANMIAVSSGGRIEVESEQGIGTVFSVFLPVRGKMNRSSGSEFENVMSSPGSEDQTKSVPLEGESQHRR